MTKLMLQMFLRIPFDRFSAYFFSVDFRASGVSEDCAEGCSADVLGHLDQVTESVLGQPVWARAGNGAHDVLAVPENENK